LAIGRIFKNLPILSNQSEIKVKSKIYLHWTATGYDWVVPGHYHTIVTGDGKVHRLHSYEIDLNSHTYMRNTDSLGLAIACMGGEDPWSTPPTWAQVDALCREVAAIAKSWNWHRSNIFGQTILTHAEAASNLDGWDLHENYGPVEWGGTGERWDLMRLTRDGTGDVGLTLRLRILEYFTGEFFEDEDRAKDRPIPLTFSPISRGIEVAGKLLPAALDNKGITWSPIADLLEAYELAYTWDSAKRQVVLEKQLPLRALANKVSADVGHPLCELVCPDRQSVLTGIVREDGRSWCQTLEFAEELGISCRFKPLVLLQRRGG
jgi:hypothetical protein